MLVKLKPRLIKQKKKQTKQIKQLKKLKIMQKKLKKQKNLAIQKQLILRRTKQRLPLMTLNKLQTAYQMIVKIILATLETILILMVKQIATPIMTVIQTAVLILTAILAMVLILMTIPVTIQMMIMMIQMIMKINLTIHQLKIYLQMKKIFQVCQT